MVYVTKTLIILGRILSVFLFMGFMFTVFSGMGLIGVFTHFAPNVPQATGNLEKVRLQVPFQVFTADKKMIWQFGAQRTTPLKLSEIPQDLKNAFLAIEDARFYEHDGVDGVGLIRAAVDVIQKRGAKSQGASTVTMQLARNLFFDNEKSYERKIKEIFVALKIERDMKRKYKDKSKDKILELYLNKIFLGLRANGVQAAANVYYGKDVDKLTLAQYAMIAGLPKAPSRYNPIKNPKRAKIRRNYILQRMYKLGMIKKDAYDKARKAKVTAKRHTLKSEVEAPHIAELVRQQLFKKYGSRIYEDGFKVYTTIDSKHQEAANKALRAAMLEYDRRHGYRRNEVKNVPLKPNATADDKDDILEKYTIKGGLLPGLVTKVNDKSINVYIGEEKEITIEWDGLKWARTARNNVKVGKRLRKAKDVAKVGDIIRVETLEDGKYRLAQVPIISGAFVSLNPKNGAITAMVGGFEYHDKSRNGKYNRVVQARRQPGSTFKPFVYSAALEKNFTPATIFNDTPVILESKQLANEWEPENPDKKFLGPIRMREALYRSRNLAAIRVLQDTGIEFAIEHLTRFGFAKSQLVPNLSLVLGSPSVTPLELATGYSVFANGGFKVVPFYIDRVELEGKGVIAKATPFTVCTHCDYSKDSKVLPAQRVLPAQNAYQMTSMLKDVIIRGTATKARVLKRSDIAGKTGTTNDQKDAWFSGYNQYLVATVWVGFDDHRKSLGRGEYGGKAALPAWIDFMKVVMQDKKVKPMPKPSGLVHVRINPTDGLRAPAGTRYEVEIFRKKYVPAQMSSGVYIPRKAVKKSELGQGVNAPGAPGTTGGPASNSGPARPEDIF